MKFILKMLFFIHSISFHVRLLNILTSFLFSLFHQLFFSPIALFQFQKVALTLQMLLHFSLYFHIFINMLFLLLHQALALIVLFLRKRMIIFDYLNYHDLFLMIEVCPQVFEPSIEAFYLIISTLFIWTLSLFCLRTAAKLTLPYVFEAFELLSSKISFCLHIKFVNF